MRNRSVKNWILHLATRPPALALRCINAIIAAFSRDRPIHDPQWFPWIPQMEMLHQAVLKEIAPFAVDRSMVPLQSEWVPSTEFYYESSDWRHLIFTFAGDYINETCEMYPNTAAAIKLVPGVVTASVSLLGPRQTIGAHTHPYKGLLIFHFAIIVPRDAQRCTIRVGDQRANWAPGKVLVIDPTFEHDVVNDTDDVRIIIMGEFKRPDQPRVMKFLDTLFVFLMKHSPMGRGTARKIREEMQKIVDAHK